MGDTHSTITRRRFIGGTTAGFAGLVAAPAIISRRARAADATLTVTSWGGDYNKSVREVFADPFTKETGIPVTLVDNGDMAKVKAQVLSKDVQWDVIDAPISF